ncbi:hypothetical protein ABZ372_49685, partial [Streptomyces sp. NPDC005921]
RAHDHQQQAGQHRRRHGARRAAHLAPLALRNDHGGIRTTGTQVAGEPRVHLVGFGPSQSTVGSNRAGRGAVVAITKYLGGQQPVHRAVTDNPASAQPS